MAPSNALQEHQQQQSSAIGKVKFAHNSAIKMWHRRLNVFIIHFFVNICRCGGNPVVHQADLRRINSSLEVVMTIRVLAIEFLAGEMMDARFDISESHSLDRRVQVDHVRYVFVLDEACQWCFRRTLEERRKKRSLLNNPHCDVFLLMLAGIGRDQSFLLQSIFLR